MKTKPSIVWQFFDRIEDRGRCRGVVCKICAAEYKFFGNTTNLRVHLARKHPIQWELAHNNNDLGPLYEIGAKASSSQPRNRKHNIIKYIKDDTESETRDAVTFIKDIESQPSDEEWLEDPFECVETYEPTSKKIKLKKRIKQEYAGSSQNLANLYLQSSPDNSFMIQDSEQRDEYSTFGEYIANKLRKLETPRTRGNIQQIITTVLWQAEYGAYDDADSVKKLFFSNDLAKNLTASSENEINRVSPSERGIVVEIAEDTNSQNNENY